MTGCSSDAQLLSGLHPWESVGLVLSLWLVRAQRA